MRYHFLDWNTLKTYLTLSLAALTTLNCGVQDETIKFWSVDNKYRKWLDIILELITMGIIEIQYKIKRMMTSASSCDGMGCWALIKKKNSDKMERKLWCESRCAAKKYILQNIF